MSKCFVKVSLVTVVVGIFQTKARDYCFLDDQKKSCKQSLIYRVCCRPLRIRDIILGLKTTGLGIIGIQDNMQTLRPMFVFACFGVYIQSLCECHGDQDFWKSEICPLESETRLSHLKLSHISINCSLQFPYYLYINYLLGRWRNSAVCLLLHHCALDELLFKQYTNVFVMELI